MERADPQRRFAQSDPQRSISLEDTGYGAIVLDRLARQICRAAAVEWSCIFVRDRRDPRSVIAAAGHGLPWDFLGARLGADEGVIGRVLATGDSLRCDYSELIKPLRLDGSAGAAGIAVPISWAGRVEGALSAATANAG